MTLVISMDEDLGVLRRSEYDLLTLDRRQCLLRKVGEEHGMSLVGFRRFERWGVYTYSAVFEMDGREFVFVPGDKVTIGWSGDCGTLEGRTRFLAEREVAGRSSAVRLGDVLPLMVHGTREKVIPPMLVETEPRVFEGSPEGAIDSLKTEGLSIPTSDEWEYLCSGGTTSLFPWGDSAEFRMERFPDHSKGPDHLDGRNFFGISIAQDPFSAELVNDGRPVFRGGDFGGNILAGWGPVFGYLPCSPHYNSIERDPHGMVPDRFLIRGVVRLGSDCAVQTSQAEPCPELDEGVVTGTGHDIHDGHHDASGPLSELEERCEEWHRNGEHQRIVNTIEALPDSLRTPQLTSTLARAYNNLGGPDDRSPFLRAIELLESVGDDLRDDFLWNYRMGYSYVMLDREPESIPYLERAAEIDSDDEDNQELLEMSIRALTLPRFRRCFRERAEITWRRFSESMSEVERLYNGRDREDVREEAVSMVEDILGETLADESFEIGHDGERYELVLSPEANRTRLLELVELARHAPAEVLDRWRITIGRRVDERFHLDTEVGTLYASDVEAVVERVGDYVHVTLHCPKLDGMMDTDGGQAWWIVSALMEHALGEVPAMAALNGMKVVRGSLDGDVVRLSDLRSVLVDMGFNMEIEAEGYLSMCTAYKLDPVDDPDADWRMDVMVGSTRCPQLVMGYLSVDDECIDRLHADGAVAGFFVYPLDGFEGDDRAERILEFREDVEEGVMSRTGDGAVTFIGGATGTRCGYSDFIAWDLEAVLSAAVEFFEGTDIEWASYHPFRRAGYSVSILDRTDVVPPEVPILSDEDVERLESYLGDVSGRFGMVLSDLTDILDAGVREGRFNQRQARADLDVALWYAYACLNIGDYEHYWMATQWMPSSECNASGCGTWFYRYSCALMYTGRLEEARDYAERGVVEEPGYPWIWLQAAKLRAHFGDVDGAMDAVRHGLELVPGDYEFTVLSDEISAGKDLDSFEFHWIDPGADAALQSGEDPDAEGKLRVIDCIMTDPEGAERFRRTFDIVEGTWMEDSPYCSFDAEVRGTRVRVLFRTNMAALSKVSPDWTGRFRDALYGGSWVSYGNIMRRKDPLFRDDGTLEAVAVNRDLDVELTYRLSNGRTVEVLLDDALELSDRP